MRDKWFFIEDEERIMGPYSTYDEAREMSDRSMGSEPFSMDPGFMIALLDKDAKRAVLDLLEDQRRRE